MKGLLRKISLVYFLTRTATKLFLFDSFKALGIGVDKTASPILSGLTIKILLDRNFQILFYSLKKFLKFPLPV